MEELFITKIHIHEVRHLKDFDIPLSETERKHLILIGRNGSGKTSVLEAIGHTLFRLHGGQALRFQDPGEILIDVSIGQRQIHDLRVEGKLVTAYFEAKRGPNFETPTGVKIISLEP